MLKIVHLGWAGDTAVREPALGDEGEGALEEGFGAVDGVDGDADDDAGGDGVACYGSARGDGAAGEADGDGGFAAEGFVEAGAEVGHVLEGGVGGYGLGMWGEGGGERGVEFALRGWVGGEVEHEVCEGGLGGVVAGVHHCCAFGDELVEGHGRGIFFGGDGWEVGEEVWDRGRGAEAFDDLVVGHCGKVVGGSFAVCVFKEDLGGVVPGAREVGEGDVVASGGMEGVHCVDLDDLPGFPPRRTDVIAFVEEPVGVRPDHGGDGVVGEHVEPWSEIKRAVDYCVLVRCSNLSTGALDYQVAAEFESHLHYSGLHGRDLFGGEDMGQVLPLLSVFGPVGRLSHGWVSSRYVCIEFILDDI